MKDQSMTKNVLIRELVSLRHKIEAFEQSELERKKAFEVSQEGEAYFKAIIQNSSDIILVVNKLGTITYASPSVERVLGYAPDELIGKNSLDLIVPEDKPRAIADFGRALLVKAGLIPNVFRIKHKNGTERIFEGVGNNLLDNPIVAGFVMNVRDITERKRAEEKETETAHLLQTLFDSNPTGILLINARTRVIASANPMALRILDYSKEEVIGEVCHKYICPAELHFCPILDKGQSVDRSEKMLIAKNNKPVPILKTVVTLNINNEPYLLESFIDITEHKLAEEELQAAFEKRRELEFIINHSPAVVWLWKAAEGWPVEYVSGNLALYGYTPDDFTSGRIAFASIVHPDDLPRVAAEVERYTREGRTEFTQEYRIFSKSRATHWIDDRTWVRRGSDGSVTHYQGIAMDITDRKQAMGALKESEEQYRTLVDNIDFGINLIDKDFKIITTNVVSGRQFNKPAGELIGKYCFNEFEKQQKVCQHCPAVQAMATGRPHQVDTEGVRDDGSRFSARISAFPLFYSDGTTKGFVEVVEDITDRRQTEEALRDSEALFRKLFEDHAAVKLILDPDTGKIIDANEAAAVFYGWPREQLKQMKIQEINTLPPEKVKKEMERVRTEKKIQFEFRHRRADGSIRDVQVFSSTIEANKKDLLHSIVHDISDRKRAEEELQRTLDSLRKAVGTTIQVMVSAVETRDPYTAGHQIRSADLARAIATEMGLSQEKIDGIRMAGSIHDIGKLSIPAEILSKPTKLTKMESLLVKEHAKTGYEILKDVESPWPLAEIVYQHHERMDGSGYPRNLKGDEIIMEARIMAVADVVEAMASHRPYRPGLGIDAALEEIEKNRGALYDATVAEACLKLFREKDYQLEEA
jgi:PAS domain S-box-containing protein